MLAQEEERLKIAHGCSINYVDKKKIKDNFANRGGSSSKDKAPQQFQQHKSKLGQCTMEKDQCLLKRRDNTVEL